MYSSSKNPLVDGVLVGQMGLAIAKRLEVDSGTEVTRDAIFDEIHPPEEKAKTKFNKPKPPPSRGARYVSRRREFYRALGRARRSSTRGGGVIPGNVDHGL